MAISRREFGDDSVPVDDDRYADPEGAPTCGAAGPECERLALAATNGPSLAA